MGNCVFCNPEMDADQQIVMENDHCMFVQKPQQVLKGSGLIVPKAHRETVFDLTDEEWADHKRMLDQVKEMLDEKLQPDGYNVGYNCYEVGGQHIFHAHMHIIPRFKEEPYAGKGIRHWLKKEENKY
jgi:histidine triad (HIT) family protein